MCGVCHLVVRCRGICQQILWLCHSWWSLAQLQSEFLLGESGMQIWFFVLPGLPPYSLAISLPSREFLRRKASWQYFRLLVILPHLHLFLYLLRLLWALSFSSILHLEDLFSSVHLPPGPLCLVIHRGVLDWSCPRAPSLLYLDDPSLPSPLYLPHRSCLSILSR
jgi:hypothetical protein